MSLSAKEYKQIFAEGLFLHWCPAMMKELDRIYEESVSKVDENHPTRVLFQRYGFHLPDESPVDAEERSITRGTIGWRDGHHEKA